MSYTLKDLKDGIYKALGEFSANGEALGEMSYNRADLSHRIIPALNSAICRASMSLPVFTKRFMPRFIKPECVFSEKAPFEIQGANIYRPGIGLYQNKLSFSLLCAGELCVKLLNQDNVIVFENNISSPACRFEQVSFSIDNLPIGKKRLEISAVNSSAAIRELDIYENAFEKKLIPKRGYSAALLPEDFGSLEGCSVNGKAYCKSGFIVGDGVVLCPSGLENDVTVYYTPKNLEITGQTDENTQISLPDITCIGVIYLAAAELCENGDGELYSKLMYKYRDIALNCYDKKYAPRVYNSFFEHAKGVLKGEARCRM